MASMRRLVLIAHDIRSTHNVGSLLRTADGLGVEHVYLTGYTPYPAFDGDTRLPHEAARTARAINKTALGAENSVAWTSSTDVLKIMSGLKRDGFDICALEQTDTAIALNEFKPNDKTALLVGREVEGIEPELLNLIPTHLVIPMYGTKESFNVVQAAAMALYHLRFA
jgi:23S rRNA (guanosine2251-2'-O)-methyltransferase